MSNDQNAKARPARLGRGLSSLMANPSIAPGQLAASEFSVVTPETSAPPRARLATVAPAEMLAEGDPSTFNLTDPPPAAIVRSLSITAITPNPYQPRKQFDLRALEQLAASIRLDGVMQPILVRPRPGHANQYELIAGERRWRAAQLADLAEIPAIVRDLGDQDTAEWALIENLQREDLNPIERGEAFQQLIDRYELSHEQVADRVRVERSTISNSLRLLSLHDDVQQFVRDGLLAGGHAKVLAGVSDSDAQRALAIQAVKESWSVRQVERAVRDLLDSTGPASDKGAGKIKRARTTHTADLERQLTQQLSTKVRIQQGKKKGTGTLAIDFYSLEHFDDLIAKLGAKLDG